MALTIGQDINDFSGVQGKSFYNDDPQKALIEALGHASEGGFVASMPQFLQGRILALYRDEVWAADYLTANSEGDVGKTPVGNEVLIVVHGGGIFSSPKRIKKALEDGLTPTGAGKLYDEEIKDLLEGKLPDKTTIPVYSFADFRDILELPRRYAVVIDFPDVLKSKRGCRNIEELIDNYVFIAHAGGVEQAKMYFGKVKSRFQNRDVMYGNGHLYSLVNPNQPQGTLLNLHKHNDNGISVVRLNDPARFVGVSPESLDACTKGISPKGLVEEVMVGHHSGIP